jgi:glutamyl-tRNA reductase
LAQLRQVRRQRHGRNLFLVDLAVPRDIDPLVASLDGVFLYNVDNLAQVAEEALLGRRLEADKASAIVVEEARVFLSRAHAERITPSLVALRNRFRGLLEAELERSLRGNRAPADDRLRKSLHAALVAAVEKTLHGPTERLRAWAKDDSFGDWHTDLLLSAITELFDLREDADDTVGVREGGKS